MSKPFFIFIVVAAFVVVAAVAWFANNQSQVGNVGNTDAEVNTTQTVNTNTVTSNTNKNANTSENVNTVVDESDDFTLVQPAEPTTNGEITTYIFAETNVMNVMPASMQSITVAETTVKERTPIMIGDTAGERLTVSSAKDGSDQVVVQVVLNETLYDFRGSADFLDKLADYVTFN